MSPALWSHLHLSSSFLNFFFLFIFFLYLYLSFPDLSLFLHYLFMLNRYVNSWIYSSKSSGSVLSGFFLISPLSCFLLSVVFVALVLLELNHMSLCFIVQFPGHLVNLIIPFFQLTSGLCLTNQLCPRNMSVPSRSVTPASKVSLCPLISIPRGATLVTSLFFVPLVLNTSNKKFIGLVWILLSLTSCLLIPVCI